MRSDEKEKYDAREEVEEAGRKAEEVKGKVSRHGKEPGSSPRRPAPHPLSQRLKAGGPPVDGSFKRLRLSTVTKSVAMARTTIHPGEHLAANTPYERQ